MNTIAGKDISQLVEEFGTPLYVYDKAKIVTNFHGLKSAFENAYPNVGVHYSVKANNNVNILKTLLACGAGADVSSPNEAALAKYAGFADSDIIYTGNYESVRDFEYLSQTDIQVNFDDLDSFKRYIKFKTPEVVSFRINPGIGRGGFEGITTGGVDAKFGTPYEKAYEAYKFALDMGIRRFGVHMMTGSNNLEPYTFMESVDKLLKIIKNVFVKLGASPEYIDIGGGFGVPYADDEAELDINETAALVSETILEKCEKYGFATPRLLIEPGRYIVANAGYLIGRVSAVKHSYKTFVGLDLGMNTLLRPALYGAFHRVSVYGKPNLEQNVNLCGNICENSDIFAKNIFMPKVTEGDIVVFRDAGAYGYAMASNYNGRLRPAEIMIAGDNVQTIRRAETFEDLIRMY